MERTRREPSTVSFCWVNGPVPVSPVPVSLPLCQEGLVKLEDYYFDGTKIEANANRYTFVWRKATEKYDQKLDEKYQHIVMSIQNATQEDELAEEGVDVQEKVALRRFEKLSIIYIATFIPPA